MGNEWDSEETRRPEDYGHTPDRFSEAMKPKRSPISKFVAPVPGRSVKFLQGETVLTPMGLATVHDFAFHQKDMYIIQIHRVNDGVGGEPLFAVALEEDMRPVSTTGEF